MPEKNVVAASDVDGAAAIAGASGHGCLSSSRSPTAVDASPLPLMSDLRDPFKDLPAFDVKDLPVFDEVISDEEPEVLPQTNLYS